MTAVLKDAHSTRGFDLIRGDIDQTRRAGLPKASVLNCQSWEPLARLFRRWARGGAAINQTEAGAKRFAKKGRCAKICDRGSKLKYTECESETFAFVPDGFQMPRDRAPFTSAMNAVDEDYFETMRFPLLAVSLILWRGSCRRESGRKSSWPQKQPPD